MKLLLLVEMIGFLSSDFRDLRSFRAEFSGEGATLFKGVPLGKGSLWLNGDRFIEIGDTEALGMGLLTEVRFLAGSI